jgi:protein TonB
MFETSVVAQTKATTRRLSLLSVSFLAHVTIAFCVVAVSVASVRFPAVAPDEYALAPVFAVVQIPPPLGDPNGGKPRAPEPQPVKPPAPQPANQQTAPTIVPETVTPVESTGTGDSDVVNPGGTSTLPIGVPWGKEDSPGSLDAPPVVDAPAAPPSDEVIYQPHEVVAPVLVRKVDPRYPQGLSRVGVSATVIVRCVIDKSGSVRDAEVVVPSSLAPFNAEVLNAVQQWKYKPATLAGQPVNSYLMLTVHFSVKR